MTKHLEDISNIILPYISSFEYNLTQPESIIDELKKISNFPDTTIKKLYNTINFNNSILSQFKSIINEYENNTTNLFDLEDLLEEKSLQNQVAKKYSNFFIQF